MTYNNIETIPYFQAVRIKYFFEMHSRKTLCIYSKNSQCFSTHIRMFRINFQVLNNIHIRVCLCTKVLEFSYYFYFYQITHTLIISGQKQVILVIGFYVGTDHYKISITHFFIMIRNLNDNH